MVVNNLPHRDRRKARGSRGRPVAVEGAGVEVKPRARRQRNEEKASVLQDDAAGIGPEGLADATQAIRAAAARSDWEDVLRLWQTLHPAAKPNASIPDAAAYASATLALRKLQRFADADALLAEAVAHHPDNSQFKLDRGWLEVERRNWEAALQRWAEARASVSDNPAVPIGESIALRELRRFDEAEAVLAEAVKCFPDDFNVLVERAWAASALRDWPEALARFRHALAVNPGHDHAQRGLRAALRELGEYDEAERIIEDGLRDDPRSPQLLIEHAEIARSRADWWTAGERWRAAMQVSDGDPRPVTGLADALMRRRQYVEAEEILVDAVRRFPHVPALAMMFAACASRTNRFAEALLRWQDAHNRFPDDSWGTSGLILAMIDLGDFAEAQALTEAELSRDPAKRGALEGRAYLAGRTGDWTVSVATWQQLVDAYPNDVELRKAFSRAILESELAGLDRATGDGLAAPEADRVTMTPGLAAAEAVDLVMSFESLGDNCEFGIFQRHFGAEPLGLLRWATIKPDNLIEAVGALFAGVEEAENIIIETYPSGEYGVRDRRYGIHMHTFVYESSIDRNTFFTQQVRRARFLKDKLLKDIVDAVKIFVYRSDSITDQQARTLHGRLRRIGPITLLVVRRTNPMRPPGTVEVASEGLLFGYIDTFQSFDGPTTGLSIDCWTDICRKAYAIWKAGTAPAPL